MKNSADENPTLTGLIEDDVPALLDSAKTWMDCIACSPETGSLSDAKKAFNKTVEINISLGCTPDVGRVVGNSGEVQFG